jgi:hypothetical protein
MDPTISNPSSMSIMVRFINISLLCVQESPTDRPTMPDVVSMISNEHALLPKPKQPAFTTGWNMETNSTIDSAGNCSTNSVTISTMEARWLAPISKKRNVLEPIFLFDLFAHTLICYVPLNVVSVHASFSFVPNNSI